MSKFGVFSPIQQRCTWAGVTEQEIEEREAAKIKAERRKIAQEAVEQYRQGYKDGMRRGQTP